MDLIVEFEVLENHRIVAKTFSSLAACKSFINRARHSKKVRLVSYPNLRY